MIDIIESPNSVPLPDDTNVLLDIPENKQESLSEIEQEIEEWDFITSSKLLLKGKQMYKITTVFDVLPLSNKFLLFFFKLFIFYFNKSYYVFLVQNCKYYI